MARNKKLHIAKRNKNDEFYTQLIDIENELKHYKEHLKGKVVYSNCDTESSNFVKYFTDNFDELQLKDFIYSSSDFREQPSTDLLSTADIVVTNPPFSLFREYVAQLMEYDKKFIIIGHLNAVTYKEIFPFIKENKLWLGPSISSGDREFQIPESIADLKKVSRIETDTDGKKLYFTKVMGVRWFTNLPHKKRNEKLILFREYKENENDYPKYDNYDAIEVSRVVNIPKDFTGFMGVPISFLDKYNPEQFEIVNANNCKTNPKTPNKKHGLIKDKDGTINGKPKYARIVIKRTKQLTGD